MNALLSKDFAEVYVAIVWVLFWLIVLFKFRGFLQSALEALLNRIQAGASVVVGPVTIGEPPKSLSDTAGGVAVSDDGPPLSPIDTTNLDRQYKDLLDQTFFLLHATEVVRERTSPRSGRYRVRVWVESYHDVHLSDIEEVTYRVWDDFPQRVISTSSSKSNFDLWLNVYGEFPVLALIKRRSGPPVILSRYIDLPGRPPD